MHSPIPASQGSHDILLLLSESPFHDFPDVVPQRLQGGRNLKTVIPDTVVAITELAGFAFTFIRNPMHAERCLMAFLADLELIFVADGNFFALRYPFRERSSLFGVMC